MEYINYIIININWGLGIGDWGLGNPQSPIPNNNKVFIIIKHSLYKLYYSKL